MTETPLAEFFRSCQLRVEACLAARLNAAEIQSADLKQAMEHACLKGGKRVRPLLVYGSALAVGNELSHADTAATAVELLHCYSLVHDDLPCMDNDDLRRGIPTVHKAYGEALAVLTGDALQSLAFQIMSDATVSSAQQLAMINRLAVAAGAQGMVAGQALDFVAVGKSLTLQQLRAMHSLKTGALISASVMLGALCGATVDQHRLDALETYAAKIGLAFQVQDDILDVTTGTATLGKPQGSDQAQNKPTFTSLLGVDGAMARAGELVAEAVAALEGFPAAADILRQLAVYIVERQY